MIDFQKLTEIIRYNQTFLVTTHVNPDADAIGSEITFCEVMIKLGKVFKVINHSATPYNLKFLDSKNLIEKFDINLHEEYFSNSDVLVALDFNRADRMVSMEMLFRESTKLKICIDHHQNPEDFVNFKFVDSKYAATGHILYDFIKQSKIVKLDKSIAAPIYAAIMTDTGSFRFERTTAELHRIIAELVDTGINPTEIYNEIYDESRLSKIKLLGKSLTSLKLIADNKIGYMIITQEDFKTLNALESDTENFVNLILSVEGVKVALLFIELKNGFKVSFRSKDDLPINELAGLFGGGGHLNAAGARFINSNMSQMIPQILNEAEEFLINYTKG